MGDSIRIYLDGEPYSIDRRRLTVAELLDRLGRGSADISLVVVKDGKERREYRDLDQLVEVRDGDEFETRGGRSEPPRRPEVIHYKVNGEAQSTRITPLSVADILTKAGTGASIDPNEIRNYFLENIEDGRKYENPEDMVDISEGDQFLAIHQGPTPVA